LPLEFERQHWFTNGNLDFLASNNDFGVGDFLFIDRTSGYLIEQGDDTNLFTFLSRINLLGAYWLLYTPITLDIEVRFSGYYRAYRYINPSLDNKENVLYMYIANYSIPL
jgi:hypothetical protein